MRNKQSKAVVFILGFPNLMDPEAFAANFYKWDSRAAAVMPPQNHRLFEAVAPPPPPPPTQNFHPPYCFQPREVVSGRESGLGALVDFFQPYGIRHPTILKLNESGFTVSTLLDLREEELDEIMIRLSQIFHCDLLIGEQYGVKAAVRSERRRRDNATNPLDALSQGGLSEELQREAAGSGGGATWDMVTTTRTTPNRKIMKKKKQRRNAGSGATSTSVDDDDEVNGEENVGSGSRGRGRGGRQREHPFIVTERGEVARGKKNGLDYLFHLYEQCAEFLVQVQNMAKDKGEKVPNKVTNQVYRCATEAGATYINKPKIRFYVHCYALHCLDEKASDALRKACKERRDNIGVWRQACYEPLVKIASQHGWDIDAIFNAHPRLSIWYVPTMLRKLCHAERSALASAENSA